MIVRPLSGCSHLTSAAALRLLSPLTQRCIILLLILRYSVQTAVSNTLSFMTLKRIDAVLDYMKQHLFVFWPFERKLFCLQLFN